MAMKAVGQSPALARRFDNAIKYGIDFGGDRDLGPIIRQGVFGPDATREPSPVATTSELVGTDLEVTISSHCQLA
jgi:hypothetical protein